MDYIEGFDEYSQPSEVSSEIRKKVRRTTARTLRSVGITNAPLSKLDASVQFADIIMQDSSNPEDEEHFMVLPVSPNSTFLEDSPKNAVQSTPYLQSAIKKGRHSSSSGKAVNISQSGDKNNINGRRSR